MADLHGIVYTEEEELQIMLIMCFIPGIKTQRQAVSWALAHAPIHNEGTDGNLPVFTTPAFKLERSGIQPTIIVPETFKLDRDNSQQTLNVLGSLDDDTQLSIHPSQIDILNEPLTIDVATCRRLLSTNLKGKGL